jgi:hypothetical protein
MPQAVSISSQIGQGTEAVPVEPVSVRLAPVWSHGYTWLASVTQRDGECCETTLICSRLCSETNQPVLLSCLAVRNISRKSTMPSRDWKAALTGGR